MLGQCVFCSWYGVRLRRAPYLQRGQQFYHSHCVRIALDSPDPVDRELAEKILRSELPRLVRDRFWERNPPNRTFRSSDPPQELTAGDFDHLCRRESLGTGDALRELLSDRVRWPGAELAPGSGVLDGHSGAVGVADVDGPGPGDYARRLQEQGIRAEVDDDGCIIIAPALPPASRKRRQRSLRSNVDRAVEVVSRLSEVEIQEFRRRLAGLSAIAPAA